MARTRTCMLGIALAGTLAAPAAAQALRSGLSAQEVAQIAAAAGLSEKNGMVVNVCGRQIQPRFAPADLNGDGKPEIIAAEIDPACHGGTGEKASILWRDPSGRWQLVGATLGRMKLLPTSSRGWREYSLEGTGCQPVWGWDGARYIIQRNSCGAAQGVAAAAAAPAAKAPATAAPAPAAAGDRAAIFKALGVVPVGGRYLACNKQGEMEVEVRDLNGDGRPDAVVQDFGTECYGRMEQGFTILSKDAAGAWRKTFESPGIATFQTTRGAGGWPDVEIGGPGFCFPVHRWNGRTYAFLRNKADPASPRACDGR